MNKSFGEADYRFAQIIWEHEPISSGELVVKANEILGWKKSTTYTVLKKLCDRGFFINQNAIVTSLISEDDVQLNETSNFLDKVFSGSLPNLISSLANHKALSRKEIDELQQLIDSYREEDDVRDTNVGDSA